MSLHDADKVRGSVYYSYIEIWWLKDAAQYVTIDHYLS